MVAALDTRAVRSVDPEGEFADYYGKSLSSNEMLERVSKLIGDWERQKWWDSVLPAWMATPQLGEAQKVAAEAAKKQRVAGSARSQ